MTDLEVLVRERADAEWCLFVDRDGVINRRVVGGYVRSWSEFSFVPGAVEALVRLALWAPHVVVVTNQQGVGKGVMSDADLDEVHARMLEVLAVAGATVDAVLVCPHLASAGCACRKPSPGLARAWLAEHRACDGALSVMLGDSDSDMVMARRLGDETGGCVAIGIGGANGADTSYRSLTELGDHVTAYLEGTMR
jgi:D-glycero-D-manno-heptose 1,7-bisphosphate phosphatase